MTAPTSRSAAELLAVGQLFRQYGGEQIALEVAAAGGGLPELHRRLGERIRRDDGLRGLDTAAGVRLDERDLGAYSITRAIRGEMQRLQGWRAPKGNPFDANDAAAREIAAKERGATSLESELSVDLQRRSGWAANGLAVPWSALARDFNVGAASEAGNLVAAGSKRLDLTPDAARPALALQRLGCTVAGGFTSTFSVPTLVSDQTGAAFLTEVGTATEGQPSSGLVTFEPRRVSAYVEVSKQFIIAGGALADAIITKTLRDAVFARLEDGAINGDGLAGAPLGLRNVSGIGTVVAGANGAAPALSHFLDLEQLPAAANAQESERGGYLINSKTRRLLKSTPKGTNLPFLWDGGAQPLNGYRAAVTNNVPSNLTKGTSTTVCSAALFGSDWSEVVLAIFGQPDLVVDPFSKADRGQVRLVFSAYVAPGALRPSGLAKIDDLLTL
jgi:HK97 family phage major capsid protein